MRLFSLLICCLLGSVFPATSPGVKELSARAAATKTDPDSVLFVEKQQAARAESTTPLQTLAVARTFLGTPYVKGCLDRSKEEHLTVNLRELDCWTFVENSFAIAQSATGNFEDYTAHLQQLRYWGGTVDGYGSRIHYFTGWILQAEKAGLLRDLSHELGGIPYRKKIGYISARPGKFPKVQQASALHDLQAAEKRINAHAWFYIPQNRIAQMEHLIREGDIVSLTSAKADLDIAHQGFAVKVNGRIHLMHASSLSGRVIVSKQPLPTYVTSQKGQTGIMVARLQ